MSYIAEKLAIQAQRNRIRCILILLVCACILLGAHMIYYMNVREDWRFYILSVICFGLSATIRRNDLERYD